MSNGVKVDPEEGTLTGVRKLRKSGNSVVLTIPSEILDSTGLESGERAAITAEIGGDEIRVRPVEEDDES